MPIPNTQTVAAKIAPGSLADTYATHVDTYGEGGFRSITTGASGTAIDSEINAQVAPLRRKVGMLVYDVSTSKYHRCTGISGTWVTENFGANSGSVTSVSLTMPGGLDVGGSPVTGNGVLAVTTSLSGIVKAQSGSFVNATSTDYSAPGHTHPVSEITSVAPSRLIGRYTNSNGPGQSISIGTGLSLNDQTGVLTASGSGGTVTQVNTSGPISGGPINAIGTIGHATSGVSAGVYGSASVVPIVSVDQYGHVYNVLSAAIDGFLELDGGGTVEGFITTTGNVTVGGDLTVNGTTTTINTENLTVEDHQIEIGKVGVPDDTTALNGGLVLKGQTDKSITWAGGDWNLSENCDLATTKVYKINGTTVLSGTSLGTAVTGSSLTSVGALASGSLGPGFTAVAVARGGTGVATLTGLVKGNGTSAFTSAVVDEDYLSPNSDIDGGTY